MKPKNPGGHAAYQVHVLNNLHKYYPDMYDTQAARTREIANQVFNLDLSPVDEMMADLYAARGPKPRLPSCMVRSLLLYILFKANSITAWVRDLKSNPMYAILSGFDPEDVPGVGTFYDFIHRLWNSDSKNLTPHVHPPKARPEKPKHKEEKAPPVEKITCAHLIKQLQKLAPPDMDPCKHMLEIFRDIFLKRSVNEGLIDLKHLCLAGDGTPIETATRDWNVRMCDCLKKGIRHCSCPRFYRHPDTDVGWDSHRNKYYVGYDFYLFTDANSFSNLPIFGCLGPASRHDSFGFLYTLFLMMEHFPEIHIDEVLLDSAHDAMAIYQLMQDLGIKAYIDLNDQRGRKKEYPEGDYTINENGVPVCKEGIPMHSNGCNRQKGTLMYRCGKMSQEGGTLHCTCEHPCSDAKYGRTVRLVMKDNIRLFMDPPRESREWKEKYKRRTTAERDNKRAKVDYKMSNYRHYSSETWYFQVFWTMMCIHLDAWNLPDTLHDAFCNIA